MQNSVKRECPFCCKLGKIRKASSAPFYAFYCDNCGAIVSFRPYDFMNKEYTLEQVVRLFDTGKV